MLVYFTFLYGK
jgi:hypothetical protein